jgi:hypothetical protein
VRSRLTLAQVGIYTWAGIAVVMIGLYFLAKAGSSKERDQATRKAKTDREAEPLMRSINDDSVAEKPTKSFTVGACARPSLRPSSSAPAYFLHILSTLLPFATHAPCVPRPTTKSHTLPFLSPHPPLHPATLRSVRATAADAVVYPPARWW